MRLLFLLLLAAPLVAQDPLPRDIAAAHPEGKWKIRSKVLYLYLVRYYAQQAAGRVVLPDYMKRRLVEGEARRRKLSVSEADVARWLKQLNAKLRRSGNPDLDAMSKERGMKKQELRRLGRQWLLQEKVARAELLERDPSRPKDQPISHDTVILVIDTLFKEAPKKFDGLPKGVVARIGKIDISNYEYGRALAIKLPVAEVYSAVKAMILYEEVALLLGNRNPPTKEELGEQKRWFLAMEKKRIRKMPNAPRQITDAMIQQMLQQRGLTLELLYASPAFLAQARAIGHFRGKQTDETLRKYYEQYKPRYSDRVKVARILVGARAQKVPGVGRKIRTLRQGKAECEALWMKVAGGQDFFALARKHSEDADNIRNNGGIVPQWLTADAPGFQQTFEHAMKLKVGDISKPFFSQGRGYVIVKLLEMRKARPFDLLKDDVRADLADQEYALWRRKATGGARLNKELLGER